MTFDQIVESTDDFEAYSPVHYEKANIDTSYSDFAGFLRAFKKACATSFDWTFEPDEYDASILNSTGFQSSIKKRIPKMGYFLSALEALSARYMPNEPENESM